MVYFYLYIFINNFLKFEFLVMLIIFVQTSENSTVIVWLKYKQQCTHS